MAVVKEFRFLDALILLLIFFGLSDKTTLFFFPDFGADVYTLINFYSFALFALLILIKVRNISIPELSLWKVMVRFAIAYVPFYIIFILLIQGNINILPIPKLAELFRETIISIIENYMAFILLPLVIGLGGDGGYKTWPTAKKPLLVFPDLQKMIHGMPSVAFITLLHAGAYSYNSTTVSGFFISLLIAFVMFTGFLFVKETFGFGAAESGHSAWNTVLTTLRGSII